MSRRAASFKAPAWFTGFLSRYKRSVALALGLGALASGCAALLMFTSGYLISATAQEGITLFAILLPVAFVQLFGAGRPAARYVERLVSHDWVLRVTSHLRLGLFWGIEERVDDPARKRAAGEYLGVLSDDVAHLQNLYLRVVFPSAVAIALVLGASAIFGFFSPAFALLMLLIFAGTAGLLPYAALLATRAHTDAAKAIRAEETTSLTDDVFGHVDWTLSGRGAQAVARHATADAQLRRAEAKVRMVERAISLVSTLLLGGAICLVLAWSADRFGASPATANWIAAFALGFFPLIESFAVLPAALAQLPTHTESVVRIDEYLGSQAFNEAPEAEDAAPTGKVKPSSRMPLGIEIDRVSYAYPGTELPALQDVTLHVEAGTSIALLGPSGSGKSTLAEIVRGALKPDEGSVRLAAEGSPQEAGEGGGRMLDIGYLGQDPYLFNRSLRENLTLDILEVDDAKLEGILRSVGLADRFDALERGLDTIIGETGVGFSGGEAHRIALARVLAANTPIVLVDEPFAALDPRTEAELLDSLFATCADKTLLVITHHLAAIERFDRVVFMEDGRVSLDGTPSELIATSERFRSLLAFDRAR